MWLGYEVVPLMTNAISDSGEGGSEGWALRAATGGWSVFGLAAGLSPESRENSRAHYQREAPAFAERLQKSAAN